MTVSPPLSAGDLADIRARDQFTLMQSPMARDRRALLAHVAELEGQIERVRELCEATPQMRGFHEVFPGIVSVDRILAALAGPAAGKGQVVAVVDSDTCPRCRHRAHGDWCANMASDNDCACTFASIGPAAGGEL